MTKNYICPYCYTKYNPIELKFSCSSCKKDFEYKDLKFFDQLYLGYIGLRPISKCPYCDENEVKYRCPNENCQTEISFFLIRKNSPIISIIGAIGNGKTVYSLSLYQEIRKRGVSFRYVKEYDSDNIDNMKDNKEIAFEKLQEKFKKGILPQKTDIIKDENSSMTGKPFIFDFNLNKSVLLSFYDSAGEDLANIKVMKEDYRYFDASSAIILLMDIFSTEENRSNSLKVFENFIQVLQERKNLDNDKKIKIPIVVAFSKYDKVLKRVKKNDINKFKSECQWNTQNTLETIECIDKLSEKFKEKLIGIKSFEEAVSFIATCDKNFTNYRFIPIASIALNEELTTMEGRDVKDLATASLPTNEELTTMESRAKKFNPKTTESVHVELPFIYLLHQLNAV